MPVEGEQVPTGPPEAQVDPTERADSRDEPRLLVDAHPDAQRRRRADEEPGAGAVEPERRVAVAHLTSASVLRVPALAEVRVVACRLAHGRPGAAPRRP